MFKKQFQQIINSLGLMQKAKDRQLTKEDWESISDSYKETYGVDFYEDMQQAKEKAGEADRLSKEHAQALEILNAMEENTGSDKESGDLLEKMNMDNIPNAKNIVSTLKAPVYDPTGDHSLVYTWGITGIAYNKNYVKDVPDSWEDLWNPEYAGRLILLNDSRETIGMALKKNGFSNLSLIHI